MTEFVAQTLTSGGIEAVLAYYQPYSISPELSVPAFCLAHRRVKSREERIGDRRRHAIGAWLPELEFTHYLPTKHWKALIEDCDVHLSVSGNCLAATPFAMLNIPYWAWIATPWQEDREQRAQRYSPPRKLLDRWINTHGVRRLQRKVLDNGTIVALSEYTRERLARLTSRKRQIDVMPMAIDTDLFKPNRTRDSSGRRIGFVGRLTDPRKNVALLLSTTAWCRENGAPDLELVLIGESDPALHDAIRGHGLQDSVVLVEDIDNTYLPAYLNTLDLFVIPSHQEGLCIAALEAMSCGVPVVSTPCGGPREFVLDDETGIVTDGNAEALGRAILQALNTPNLRSRFSRNARRLIETRYSVDAVGKEFWYLFEKTFANTAGKDAQPN